jgi:hypothetical protein
MLKQGVLHIQVTTVWVSTSNEEEENEKREKIKKTRRK